MAERLVQREDDVSRMPPSVKLIHDIAGERSEPIRRRPSNATFEKFTPNLKPREQLPSLAGARVERITTDEAESIILRYEWLRSMGPATSASYGLRIGDELLGVLASAASVETSEKFVSGIPRQRQMNWPLKPFA